MNYHYVVVVVAGSPFLCRVTNGDDGGFGGGVGALSGDGTDVEGFSKVVVDLEHLSLIPVQAASEFTIKVAGGDDAELAVSVQGTYRTQTIS